ncbi:MAG: hypothetical protein K1X72_06435 [Pyrinomonadaceae bacterium]|nr:hypothetical protein [Pyrinomonadaceae bacterium]
MSENEEINQNAKFAVMEQSRATPIRPAIWMTGVLVWATVIGLFLQVPTWAGIFLCSLTGISFLLYLVSYSYMMIYDREALRRERLQVKGRQVVEHNSLVSANTELISEQTQSTVMETHLLRSEKETVVRRGKS